MLQRLKRVSGTPIHANDSHLRGRQPYEQRKQGVGALLVVFQQQGVEGPAEVDPRVVTKRLHDLWCCPRRGDHGILETLGGLESLKKLLLLVDR